jgi:hypothetical protein
MRRLALALAAATMLAGTVPANAQAVSVGVGFGPGWGYGGWWGGPPYAVSGNWAWGDPSFGYGPTVGFYGGAPVAETYVYTPRRVRRVVRTRVVTSYDPGFAAYAYDPYYSTRGAYVGGPSLGFGVSFGSGYGYRSWW